MRHLRLTACMMAVFALAACDAATDPVQPEAERAASETADASAVVASATGSGHVESAGEPRTFTFSAVRQGDGSVQGESQLVIHAFDAYWHTRIECLTVVGNRAFMGGTITTASGAPIVEGTKSFFWVEDNGDDGTDRISIAAFNADQDALDEFCALDNNPLPGADILEGNVTVR